MLCLCSLSQFHTHPFNLSIIDFAMRCRCGDPAGQLSTELSFVSPPAVSPDAFPISIGIIGDLGQTHNSSSTLQHLIANAPPARAQGCEQQT